MSYGGETGIRTLDTLSSIHAFQACAFSHSAISPSGKRLAEVLDYAANTHKIAMCGAVCAAHFHCSVLGSDLRWGERRAARAFPPGTSAANFLLSTVAPGNLRFPSRRWRATALPASRRGALRHRGSSAQDRASRYRQRPHTA